MGRHIDVLAMMFVLIVVLVTVAAAELVRSACQRMLSQPLPHRSEHARAPAN